jgi:hypothetical protein
VAACQLPTMPQVQQRMQDLDLKADRARQGLLSFTHSAGAPLLPSLARAVLLHFQNLDEHRRTAVEVAMRLYAMDHGRRPEKLADLVPDYLRAVPINLYFDPPRPYTSEDFATPAEN